MNWKRLQLHYALKDANELTWEYVATTLIYEFNARRKTIGSSRKSRNRKSRKGKKSEYGRSFVKMDEDSSSDESVDLEKAARTLAAALQMKKSGKGSGRSNYRCDFCGRQGHSEQTCYMNPDNTNNKLTPKMKERMMLASNVSGLDDGNKPSKESRNQDRTERPKLLVASSIGQRTARP